MNRWLIISIIILYFLNNQICWYIHPENIDLWNRLKYGILTFIFYLALEYKPQDKFFEKVFNAIVLQNAYILIFEKETTYSLNDLIFVCTFTGIQYIKHFQKEYLINLYKSLISPNKK
jgi:hypothetical protein